MNKDADVDKVIPGIKIKTKATFDFSDLISIMKSWMEYQGYGDETKNFKEEQYIERNTARGKDYEIKWKGEKIISDYFSYIIEIEFMIVGLQDVEVTENNQKLTLNKASISIAFSSSLVRNRKGKWTKDSFMKNVYEKFIVPTRIEEYKIGLYDQTYDLINQVKQILNVSEL